MSLPSQRVAMKRIVVSAALLALMLTGSAANAVLLGPLGGSGSSSEYATASDSPFAGTDFSGGYFYLEDFEDGLQNTPGVTANNGGVTSVIFGPGSHDSVDTDDGAFDGNGLAGDSWFYSSGSTGVTWTFDESILGVLPTHAGLVWTDGSGEITFEAFDAMGSSLGVVVGNHATPGFLGQTDEDRFYGVIEMGGISRIKLSNASGGIELDHLQYGNPGIRASVPEPAALLLLGFGLAAFALSGRRSH